LAGYFRQQVNTALPLVESEISRTDSQEGKPALLPTAAPSEAI
jgi:hypothetical protein